MSRTSRIQHPTGGRFVQIHAWAVSAVGFAAASVLGILDFLDRAQDRPGQPVATRQRLGAELEGIVSKNTIDKAVEVLVALGWVRKEERQAMGERNLKTWFEFALVADAVSVFLAEQGIAGIPKLGSPASQNRAQNWDPSNTEEQNNSLSGSKSERKEASDLALARRRGKKGGLSDLEIEEIIADCQFPSLAPDAVKKAVDVAAQRQKPQLQIVPPRKPARLWEHPHEFSSKKKS